MAAMEDLEARVAALEASQADYRAVLAAVNALAANQREQAFGLNDVNSRLEGLEREFTDFRQETRANFRTVDESLAEIKDLIVGRRNGN
jgi:uncharacterized coiled-coil protein SlyX